MAKKNRCVQIWGIFLHSSMPPKVFCDYLEKEHQFSTRPSGSRWAITSIASTILSSILAIDFGILAVWLTYFYENDKVIGVGLGIVIVIMVLVFISFVYGIVVVVRLGSYWLENQKDTTIDILAQGIVKGAYDIEADIRSKDDIDIKTDKFGVQIGKHVKAILNEREK